jgi:Spy/CpxP family protein refolding chaperone
MKSLVAILASALVAGAALAQSHGHGAAHGHSPYAGLEKREIKALSSDQIADLRAGRGMALAQAAELNGYPGPMHVLELAEKLELTPDQRARTQALYKSVRHAASELGARVIERERALDALFADRKATPENLKAAVTEVALLQGELRGLHLKYHLDMRDALTPQQVARYNELRGYTAK